MSPTDPSAMMAYIDDCVEYVTIDPEYLDPSASITEPLRNSRNALRYVLDGNEESLGYIATPGSINDRVLSSVLEWIKDHLDDNAVIRQRVEVLKDRLAAHRDLMRAQGATDNHDQ